MSNEKKDYVWPTFNQHISETLKQMMLNNEFTDITLICEDQKQISAHKNILSACSPVFRKILLMNQLQSPIIYLRGIQYSEMEAILNFIYLGETACHSDRKIEFLNVARSFEIQGLARLILDMDEDDEEEEPPKPPLNKDINQQKQEELISTNKEMNISLKMEEEDMEQENPEYEEEIDDQELKELMGNFKGVQTEKETKGNQNKKNIDGKSHDQQHKESSPDLNNMVSIEIEKKMMKCSKCPSEFSTPSGLQIHIKAKHSDGKRYKCDQCDEEYVYHTDLTRHFQSKHNGIMVKCDFINCEYQSNRPDKVRLHKQTIHQGIKFPCNHCEYKACSPCDLRKHVRGRHEGIRYKCDKCDHISFDKSTLKKHVLAIHEGVRFSCDQCERSFTLKSSLAAHKKKKHILLFKNFE